MTLDGDRDGHTYSHDEDYLRLNRQAKRVFDAIADGKPKTPEWLAYRTGDNWASISARLRDLRKAKFGAWQVERKRSTIPGLFLYRLAGKNQLPPIPEPVEPESPLPGQTRLIP